MIKTCVARRLGFSLGALALAASPGLAAPPLIAEPDCTLITADAARLSCWDTKAARRKRAVEAGDVVVLDREQQHAIKREAFGFNLPSLAIFARPERERPGTQKEDFNRIQSKVARVASLSDGRLLVTLESGAQWRQVDDERTAFPPQPGDVVEIRRAALGSFFLSYRGQAALRVHREA